MQVRDVAKRVASGDGSYGVSRYYVLLAGSDTLVNQIAIDGVILDVKFVPPPAVRAVLSDEDWPWYETCTARASEPRKARSGTGAACALCWLARSRSASDASHTAHDSLESRASGAVFVNEGARCVEAQRRLTSYTDPFAGYTTIRGGVHVVRQRSPWKASLEFDGLDKANFVATVRQVAIVTATSHVRGSVGKAPVQFKEVIGAALSSVEARAQWGAAVARTAAAYREQVLLDFECFSNWVKQGSPLSAFVERARKLDRNDTYAHAAPLWREGIRVA